MTDQREPLAAPGWPDNSMLEAAWGLIANANEGDWDKARPEWREAAVRWREAYHRTLGPASPVRDPAPHDVVLGDRDLLLLEMNLARLTDELNRIPELRREDELQLAKASLDTVREWRRSRAVRGVRDPSPPDLARQWKSRAVELMDNTNLSIVQTPENAALVAAAMSIGRAQAFFEAANELGVRGSGVVPSAPPELREAAQEVLDMLGYPTAYPALVVAIEKLRGALRGVDQGGVAPAPETKP